MLVRRNLGRGEFLPRGKNWWHRRPEKRDTRRSVSNHHLNGLPGLRMRDQRVRTARCSDGLEQALVPFLAPTRLPIYSTPELPYCPSWPRRNVEKWQVKPCLRIVLRPVELRLRRWFDDVPSGIATTATASGPEDSDCKGTRSEVHEP